jgi:hypothetical protein
MNLYDLSSELAEIRSMAESGDLSPEDQAEADRLISTALDGLLPKKVEGYCGLIRSLKLEAEAFAAEEKRLAGHRLAREGLAARLTERLQAGLEVAGVDKLKAGLFTVALQASPPTVEIARDAEIPAEYLTPQEPRIDRRGLLAAVKGGREIPGVRLTQGRHLRIR